MSGCSLGKILLSIKCQGNLRLTKPGRCMHEASCHIRGKIQSLSKSQSLCIAELVYLDTLSPWSISTYSLARCCLQIHDSRTTWSGFCFTPPTAVLSSPSVKVGQLDHRTASALRRNIQDSHRCRTSRRSWRDAIQHTQLRRWKTQFAPPFKQKRLRSKKQINTNAAQQMWGSRSKCPEMRTQV